MAAKFTLAQAQRIARAVRLSEGGTPEPGRRGRSLPPTSTGDVICKTLTAHPSGETHEVAVYRRTSRETAKGSETDTEERIEAYNRFGYLPADAWCIAKLINGGWELTVPAPDEKAVGVLQGDLTTTGTASVLLKVWDPDTTAFVDDDTIAGVRHFWGKIGEPTQVTIESGAYVWLWEQWGEIWAVPSGCDG